MFNEDEKIPQQMSKSDSMNLTFSKMSDEDKCKILAKFYESQYKSNGHISLMIDEFQDMSFFTQFQYITIVAALVAMSLGGYGNLRREFFYIRHAFVPYPEWYVVEFGTLRGWSAEHVQQLIKFQSQRQWKHPIFFGVKCIGVLACAVHFARFFTKACVNRIGGKSK